MNVGFSLPASICAVDIGGTKIACGIVTLKKDEAPVVQSVSKVPTNAQAGGKQVLATVLEAIQNTLNQARELGLSIVGVGISSAGVVDPRTGDITYANELMPGWGGTALGAEVTKKFELPCSVLNDVHAHALGEARHGAGRGKDSVLTVAVGTGIGGAFVNHGVLLLGAHDEAGHIGHVATPAAQGVSCSCGGTSHLEPVSAGPGIIKEYVRLGGLEKMEDGSALHGAEIERRAQAGEKIAQEAEARSGRALGEVLGSMCNMLDPAVIILSGSVAECGSYWHEALHEAFVEQAMPPVQNTPLVKGTLGGEAPLIGAAENLILPGYAETRF